MANIEIILNGEKIKAEEDQTILQLCQNQNIEIPTLCHDDRLEPYGSCFVCVVEVKGARTLLPACTTKLRPGMDIQTHSEPVLSARKAALELILSNHYGDCFGPCQLACPARCDAQGYTGLIASGRYKDAMRVVKDTIPLPASIGRVCPKFCEDDCRRQHVDEPVAIANLKRFVADWDLATDNPFIPPKKPSIGKKVAIIGGGPAGLATAFFLEQEGVETEVFEAQSVLGGMLYYGIPQYRLPKDLLAKEIATVTALGMKIHLNQTLGKDFTIDDLKKKGFDAVVLAIGAWNAYKLKIPNEDVENVLDGINFLGRLAKGEKVNLSGRVAIIGGGNTAFDCARTSVRLGAKEVVMVYRRTRDEMPANENEKEEALEEGVKFQILTAPLEIRSQNGKVKGLKCQKMELGEPDASGRRRPVPIEGSEFEEDFDFVIAAIGQGPEISVLGNYKDKICDGRWIKYDEKTGRTTENFIYVAGDCGTGAATIVEAFAGGKKATKAILKSFNNQSVEPDFEFISKKEPLEELTTDYFEEWEKNPRQKIELLTPENRRTNFKEVEMAYPESKAFLESQRCMECGCVDLFQCDLKKHSEEYKAEVKYNGALNHNTIDNSHPYIMREPDKCVLCSRCIRLCEEKVGLGIYGYVDRGFVSQVSPEFKHDLLDTDCISCGLCISGCPVGALVPKVPGIKMVPVTGDKIDTNCFHCSIGCATTVEVLDHSINDIYERENALCKKGRFRFPIYIPKKESEIDLSKLPKIKDAVVYPTPSLTCESYELLKNIAHHSGWHLKNYYSQGSLWQAFASQGKLPSMDFFQKPILKNALVVVGGCLEELHPIAINHLYSMKDTPFHIVNITSKKSIRLERMGAKIIRQPEELFKMDFSQFSEVVYLSNPIDCDLRHGFGSSLNIYNQLIDQEVPLRTTLFSEAKNLYSFYDCHEQTKDSQVKLYIQTMPEMDLDTEKEWFFGIAHYENNQYVQTFGLAQNFQIGGTVLSSRGLYYQNNPIFPIKSSFHQLAEQMKLPHEYDVKKFEFAQEEKDKISITPFEQFFPLDTFIKKCSR
ncbi:MAG: FAD-dependent oxidoreductase [Spirochaetes bacterium]|nr:FAD-dependent oxidoreductase [Spirochaetota bacterium]